MLSLVKPAVARSVRHMAGGCLSSGMQSPLEGTGESQMSDPKEVLLEFV